MPSDVPKPGTPSRGTPESKPPSACSFSSGVMSDSRFVRRSSAGRSGFRKGGACGEAAADTASSPAIAVARQRTVGRTRGFMCSSSCAALSAGSSSRREAPSADYRLPAGARKLDALVVEAGDGVQRSSTEVDVASEGGSHVQAPLRRVDQAPAAVEQCAVIPASVEQLAEAAGSVVQGVRGARSTEEGEDNSLEGRGPALVASWRVEVSARAVVGNGPNTPTEDKVRELQRQSMDRCCQAEPGAGASTR